MPIVLTPDQAVAETVAKLDAGDTCYLTYNYRPTAEPGDEPYDWGHGKRLRVHSHGVVGGLSVLYVHTENELVQFPSPGYEYEQIVFRSHPPLRRGPAPVGGAVALLPNAPSVLPAPGAVLPNPVEDPLDPDEDDGPYSEAQTAIVEGGVNPRDPKWFLDPKEWAEMTSKQIETASVARRRFFKECNSTHDNERLDRLDKYARVMAGNKSVSLMPEFMKVVLQDVLELWHSQKAHQNASPLVLKACREAMKMTGMPEYLLSVEMTATKIMRSRVLVNPGDRGGRTGDRRGGDRGGRGGDRGGRGRGGRGGKEPVEGEKDPKNV